MPKKGVGMIIVLMGIQGCGKGTQAKLLASEFSWQHINLGGLFRVEINKKTKIGNEIKLYIDKGHLVPDPIVFETVEKALGKKKRGFVCDGFPRTLNQAEYLTEKHEVDLVIYFDLDDETARNRMDSRRICSHCHKDYNILSKPPQIKDQCDDCHHPLFRREDDSLEAINQRINLFHEQTKPLYDFFLDKGILFSINADQDIDTVHQMIKEEINRRRP